MVLHEVMGVHRYVVVLEPLYAIEWFDVSVCLCC